MSAIVMLWICGALLAWTFVGCGVLAAIDSDGRLLRWVDSAPREWMKSATILLWPAVVYFYFRRPHP